MKRLLLIKIGIPFLKFETWRLKKAKARLERDIKVLQYDLRETNSQIEESLEIVGMYEEKILQGKIK